MDSNMETTSFHTQTITNVKSDNTERERHRKEKKQSDIKCQMKE